MTAASAAPRRGRRKGDDVRRPGDPERDPLLQAARLAIAGRREAERHLTALKRAFGAAPIALGEQAGHAVDSAVLALFGASLDAAAEG